MARKIKIGNKTLKVRNPIASSLSDPKFRQKIAKDKRKYSRKKKYPVTHED
jgi:stalled ribosome alternative rescue factor ArfA